MISKTTMYRVGGLGLGAVAIAASLGAASSAGAATLHGQSTVTATTKIITRFDGGGGGNWAYDGTRAAPFTRVLTITYLGKAGPAGTPYQYEASLTDKAGFATIPGALTPNQGGRDAGKVLGPTQALGTMTGYGEFGVFDTSAKVNSPRTFANLGVPVRLSGTAQNALYPSTGWPMLAFPAGTTEVGLSESAFAYGYKLPAVTTVSHGKKHTQPAESWQDTGYNGDGQLAFDGNITR